MDLQIELIQYLKGAVKWHNMKNKVDELTCGKSHRTLIHDFCEGKSCPTVEVEFFKCADRERDKGEQADLTPLFKKALVDFYINSFQKNGVALELLRMLSLPVLF